MFLKSLTLKGFKSFADKTTLEFEPGVTVVVGPNGSGKSNLVDAVAWVLGAQGPRTMRGGKMDDVIFAGTADRPALGRAEVSLTIDNTAGLLPIEFSEVTITRTLFRTGESEYMINGAPCRLLDISELLSDTGIGRQQHVIVGQGQLDTVLNARPEDRRAIIEEAAGILKFRKRREKAQRRLEATEGNLLRLTDLLREVRRQLRPLERQADAARRYDGLAEELRDLRLHLAGRDVESLRMRLERRGDAHRELAGEEEGVRLDLRGFDGAVVEAEHALSRPGDDDVADLLARVEALRERARGLQALVAERRRGIERELVAVADEGVVETLVADAAALRDELAAVDADFASLAPKRSEVEAAEQRVADERAALDAAAGRDPTDPGRGYTEPAAARAETVLREAEAAANELRSRLDGATATRAAASAELARVLADLEAAVPARREAEVVEQHAAALRESLERAAAVAPDARDEGRAREAAEEATAAAEARLREAQGAASRWQARADTLALALDEVHAAAGADAPGGLAGLAEMAGMVGPLVDLLEVDAGAEAAVAVALGDALRALVVTDTAAGRAVAGRLVEGDGRGLLLVADPGPDRAEQGMLAPPGTCPLTDRVRAAEPSVDAALRRLLARVVLVEAGWEAALDIAVADPGLVAVTPAGDRFGGRLPWRVGTPAAVAVTPAALAEARSEAAAAEGEREEASAAVDAARADLIRARRGEQEAEQRERARRSDLDRAVAAAATARREVEVRDAALAERRASLEARITEADTALAGREMLEGDAASRVAAARRELDEKREALRAGRAELEHLGRRAVELRRDLDVRGAGIEQRRALLERRLAEIEARLAARPDEEAAARLRRRSLEARRAAIGRIGTRLADRASAIERHAERLRDRRRQQSEAAREAGRRLDALRTERAAAEKRLGELRERLSRVEVEEAELRLRLENAVEGIRRDFDCEPQVAVDAALPDVPDGITPAGRARELERELRLLGPVNPLALAEYEALLERHEFLGAQLDDVKNTRRELSRVIKAVDAEIVNVFQEAFTDVAANFSALFSTLFPGGAGRLVLTDPTNPLDTGVEIEARPSGKNVRRLSLLSGGERSLTALAYLFAVFRARPSPFYLMDEVEAALDDINLHRFLDLVHEFREEAQLVVVSHQKRTMEAADILYGVSMPPGGSSRVVSQRLRDLTFEDV